MFQPAELIKTPLRMAIYGPAGCGKTMTSLLIAREIVGPKGKIALIDTEHGSSTKHARRVQFDVTMLTNFHPARYVEAIQAAQKTHDLAGGDPGLHHPHHLHNAVERGLSADGAGRAAAAPARRRAPGVGRTGAVLVERE